MSSKKQEGEINAVQDTIFRGIALAVVTLMAGIAARFAGLSGEISEQILVVFMIVFMAIIAKGADKITEIDDR